MIEGFLDRLDNDRHILLIAGEPGIGKTVLWRESIACAEARGYFVAVAAPAESEKTLSFAALTDLFGRLPREVMDVLPVPQREAIEVAMLRRQVDAELDPRLVPIAVVTLLDELASRRRVVVAVDDAQWLDRATLRALDFAVRRAPPSVRWLVCRRASPRTSVSFPDLADGSVERIQLSGLSLAEFHHMVLRRAGQALPRSFLARVHAVTGGNPLYGLEIARTLLTESDRRPDDPIPVPANIRTVFRDRVKSLSEDARQVVLIVAALSRPTTALVATAIGDEHRLEAGLQEARTVGIMSDDDDHLRFSHPLWAAAVLASTPATRRRDVHQLLANVVDDDEERATHIARAASGPDSQTAAEVESGARRAKRRGAVYAAADLFEAAARLTPSADIDDLARRLLGAAGALHAAYDLSSARILTDRVLQIASDGDQKAEALLLMSQLAWIDSAATTAVKLLEDALGQPIADSGVLARVHAALASFQIGQPAVDHARTAAQLLDERADPGVAAYVSFKRFLTEAMLGHPPDRALFEHGLELERRSGGDFELSSIPLVWYHATDEVASARSRFAAVEQWCGDRGEEARLAYETSWLARVELRAGQWPTAVALIGHSCEVLQSSTDRGAGAVPFGVRAFIDTHLGRFEQARVALAPLVDEAERTGDLWFATFFLFQQAFLEFSVGDHASVDRLLTRLSEHEATLGLRDSPGDRREPFHIESLVAIGAVDRARRVLDELERRASVWPRPVIDASLPRARALVLAAEGDVATALAQFDAVDPSLAARLPFEHAWNQLVRGRVLRRARQKRAAANALQEALDVFERLRAVSWVAATRSELGRVGLRRGAATDLTASERHIAQLAATGMTNREVAAAAHVSPKTVEANLARIYHKLGIRSRAELGSVFAARPPAPET